MVMDTNPVIIRWLCSLLTDRQQRVVVRSSTTLDVSSEVRTNTGAPQGCVLSPALFTLYTSDCRCTARYILQVKFSDDTSLTGLITSENSYRCAVEKLVGWCNDNHLLLNVSKTKEIVGDFRRDPPPLRPLVINGEEVEIVGEYKYLGSIIDCKLDWSPNALALLKKGNQRLYFMKKLKSFSVCTKLLELFYKSTVESVATFNSLCHFGGLKGQDKARLSKIIKTASRLIGRPVPDLQAHFEAKAVKRLEAIHRDPHSPAVHRAAGPHFGKIWKTGQLSGQDKPVPFVFSSSFCPPLQYLK